MIYLQLFLEFAKVGLFTIGGGLAALPFLIEMGEKTGWFDNAFVTEMIGISESTPGPIGINMATYVGYNIGGIPGSIIASLAIALPCFLIALAVSKFLKMFASNIYVKSAFYGIRPVVIGLIAIAAWKVLKTVMFNLDLIGTEGADFTSIVDIPKLIFFAVIFFGIFKFKKHPIVYILISAVVGIIFKF